MKYIASVIIAICLFGCVFLITRSCEKTHPEVKTETNTVSVTQQYRDWAKNLKNVEKTVTLLDMDMSFPEQMIQFKNTSGISSYLCPTTDLQGDIKMNVEIGYKYEELFNDTKILSVSDTLVHIKVKTGFPIIVDTTMAYGTTVKVTGNWFKKNVSSSGLCIEDKELKSLENQLLKSSQTAIVRDIESEIIGTFNNNLEDYARSIAESMRGIDRLLIEKVRIDFEFNSTINYEYMRKVNEKDPLIEYAPIIIKHTVTVE